jgi:hypothetical protein
VARQRQLLILDNGCHRRNAPSFSQVVEVDPATGTVVWSYHGEPILAFYSFMISGLRTLPNGNTFVTEGATGRLFEVTPEHEVVWEYVSPWMLPSRFGPTSAVFRAYRVAAGDPRLAGLALDPARYATVNSRIDRDKLLGERDEVFSSALGGPIRHRNFYRRHFQPAVERAGLAEGVGFHDLRHTCAALLIANGRHLEEVKDYLGHSSIRVTSDRYGHLFPQAREAMANALDATFRAAESAQLAACSRPGARIGMS